MSPTRRTGRRSELFALLQRRRSRIQGEEIQRRQNTKLFEIIRISQIFDRADERLVLASVPRNFVDSTLFVVENEMIVVFDENVPILGNGDEWRIIGVQGETLFRIVQSIEKIQLRVVPLNV